MPYTTIYLQYAETRSSDDEVDYDIDDIDEDEFDDSMKTFVEFSPIKISVNEPRGDFLEIELDFEADIDDTLHLVIVRYNNNRAGVLEDWCLETVLGDGDEAEDFVESLEDGWKASECSETEFADSVLVKAEVFSMRLRP